MRYALALFTTGLLTACHNAPPTKPVDGVFIKNVTTDDITVVVSSDCWTRKTANYCESVSRALQRFYKADRVSEGIAATEQRYRTLEGRQPLR